MSESTPHKVLTEMADALASQVHINARLAIGIERLGKGVERIAAKYGADHYEVAEALHRLLRGLS